MFIKMINLIEKIFRKMKFYKIMTFHQNQYLINMMFQSTISSKSLFQSIMNPISMINKKVNLQEKLSQKMIIINQNKLMKDKILIEMKHINSHLKNNQKQNYWNNRIKQHRQQSLGPCIRSMKMDQNINKILIE